MIHKNNKVRILSFIYQNNYFSVKQRFATELRPLSSKRSASGRARTPPHTHDRHGERHYKTRRVDDVVEKQTQC